MQKKSRILEGMYLSDPKPARVLGPGCLVIYGNRSNRIAPNIRGTIIL